METITGQVVYSGIPFSRELSAWDAMDDDLYYYAAGTQVRSHRLSTGEETTIAEYGGTFESIIAGGRSDTSRDNWVAFQAPHERQICALNLTGSRTYCGSYPAEDKLDAVMISRSADSVTGKRYVLAKGSPAWAIWSVNEAAGRLDFEAHAAEGAEGLPGDVFEDTDGRQYLAAVRGAASGCGLELATMPLASGAISSVLPLAACGQSVDIGCAKEAPYCAISSGREISLMRANSEETRLVAKAHSALPRPALSPDGSVLAFDSTSLAPTGLTPAEGEGAVTKRGQPAATNPKTASTPTISMTPTAVSLGASQSQQFGLTFNNLWPGVTWSLNPAVGTIAGAGWTSGGGSPMAVYTAPTAITTAQRVTLTATSVWDKTKTAVATVTLQPSTITGLKVLGTTPTQAVISYNSPGSMPCTWEVSESSSYSPLVNDVNAALFAGANQDSRPGSLSVGASRMMVVGLRAAPAALDGRQYSRALQNNTQHYFRITCGTAQATGTFTTQNPAYGNTYPDVTTSMGTAAGRYSWPTIDANTGRTTDPQTGAAMWPFAFGTSWPASARNIMCSPTSQADSGTPAKYGYPCILFSGGDLYWVDATDGIIRDIGTPRFSWGKYSGDVIDNGLLASYSLPMTANGTFLAVAFTDPAGRPVLMQASYSGHWQTGDLGTLVWTNLTPSSQGKDMLNLMQQFDPTFDATLVSYVMQVGLTGDQSKVIVFAEQGQQNSTGWVAVFDPNNTSCGAGACPVAMLPLWKSAQTRWCGFHSENAVEGSGNWITFEPSWTVFNNGWPVDVNNGFNGDGPWIVNSATALTAAPQFAPGQMISGFTALAAPPGGADVLTVSGQPCDPTPGRGESLNCAWNSGYHHMMDAAVGDLIMPADNSCGNVCEVMRIIGINGNSWAVARGVTHSAQNHSGTSQYGMVCATNLVTSGGPVDVVGWNFSADPHGTGAGVAADATDIFDHGTDSNTAAAGGDVWNCPPGEASCVRIKAGTSPVGYLNLPATVTVNTAPPFAGITGVAVADTVETYTAGPPANPTVANPAFVVQTKPIEGGAFDNYTPVSGSVYKVTVNSGFGSFDPKRSTVAAVCNGLPMLDKSSSGTGNVLATDSTGSYQYCYASKANECRAGSNAGEFYANCPAFDWDNTHNYILPATSLLGKASQLRWDDAATNGRNTRPVTSAFRPFNKYSSYWSGRSFPAGNAVLAYSDQPPGGNGSAAFLVRVSPATAWDGVDRTTFVPVTVPAPGRTGTTAVAQFGHAENGPANAFFCQPRQEACVANAAVIGSPAFSWASEAPAGVACSSGCTIQIPAISGRVVYYQIVYSDGTRSALGAAVAP